MKLRILNNSLRFRLSQPEVQQLASQTPVCGEVVFADAIRLTYQLAIAAADGWSTELCKQTLTVRIPQADVQRLTDTDEVTLSAVVANDTDEPLRLKVEKDFRCLAPRDDEDESQLFDHPTNSAESGC